MKKEMPVSNDSSNDTEILTDIQFDFNFEKVLRYLKVNQKIQSGQAQSIEKLINLANELITPKAMYKVAYLETKEAASVHIGGVQFGSKVLRKNLENIERVFPYIVTVGNKLEDRATSANDLLEQYYLESIADLALDYILKELELHIKEKYKPGRLSRMNPGSLKDWPITEQKKLFSLFGDTQKIIGVSLTDSFLMIPRKSISGILFPTEINFYSCRLCSREKCERRRAPFNLELEESYDLRS